MAESRNLPSPYRAPHHAARSVVALCLCGAVAWAAAPSGTSLPVAWRLGEVDRRFGIAPAEVRRAAERAIQTWEAAAGRRLFIYDGPGAFPVRLVYEERAQQRRRAKNDLERKVAALRASVAEMRRQLDAATATYRDATKTLSSAIEAYNAKLDAYNRSVEALNAAGGATPEQARRLDSAREELERQRSDIRVAQSEVEARRLDVNARVERHNLEASAANASVDAYNSEYANQPPDRLGECEKSDGKAESIAIFAFDDLDHLARVLAHEFGHALGLDHVGGDGALMSAVERGSKGASSLRLTPRDEAELRRALGR